MYQIQDKSARAVEYQANAIYPTINQIHQVINIEKHVRRICIPYATFAMRLLLSSFSLFYWIFSSLSVA